MTGLDVSNASAGATSPSDSGENEGMSSVRRPFTLAARTPVTLSSTRALAALTGAGALALAAFVATPAATAAPAAVEPPPAGTCWNATYEQASRSTYKGAAVDCAEPHTLETAINLDVPADIAAEGPNSRELHLWIDTACQPAINRYAGVDKPDTAAGGTRTWAFWFTPTGKEWKAGNHWVSCAAGSVPKSMDGAAKLIPVKNSVADSPGRNKPRTMKSDYGLGTLTSRKPMTAIADRLYPDSEGLKKKAWQFCEKTIGSNKYFWYGPSEREWNAGWTAITCFGTKK